MSEVGRGRVGSDLSLASGHVLIVTWNGGGNFTPALALASRLVRAGHRVTVMADEASANRVEATGAKLGPYPSVEPWPQGLVFEEDQARFDEMRNGVALAKDVLGAAKSIRPDAMVVDCMSGAGLVAAELLGLPSAVLVHVLYQPFIGFWADLSVDVRRCREAFGLPALEPPMVFNQLQRLSKVLVLTPEEFDYPGAPRTAETHYVGPILDQDALVDPDGQRLGGPGPSAPLVLVSLSTTCQGQEQALPTLLEALGSLAVEAVLTLGGVVPPERVAAPENVEVLGYVPHASILPKAAAVLTHAGLSTVMTSLAYGVPLVCVPQGREQGLNAERVQACGAGISLPTTASAEEVSGALREVLEQPRFGEAARAMAERISQGGAGEAAVAHVQELLSAVARLS